MFTRVFEAQNYQDALRRMAEMRIWGEIAPVGHNRWIVWAA
jgi:hypothetical protein